MTIVVATICDETVDWPKTTSINLNNKTNFQLTAIDLLATACLLLLLVIVAKYEMKGNFSDQQIVTLMIRMNIRISNSIQIMICL